MLPRRTLCCLFLLIISVEQIVGPPAVIKNKHHDGKDEAIKTNEVDVEEMMQNNDFDVEYKRYLDEVVKTLETDEEFKKKVEASNADDVNSGKISKELDMVNHQVRSKLDELKRQEVQRLRELVKRKEDLGHGPLHPSEYEHIDHFNLETFEVKDLDNLIKKVSKDMEKMDALRKEQFKQYEMEKHFEDEMKMKNMTETEKEEFKSHLEEMKKKHANHEKIHHPGSKAQLEEVWEKQDHLENQEFDPKIFFHLHDIDGNGYWDHEEVKALFIKELDKMYQAGLPEDDMRERQEEMERMKDHVFKEMDKNGDNLISFQEYMDETKTKDFNQDEGWETLDKQQIYSQKEYQDFERQRLAEIQRMIDQGLIRPEQYPGMYHPNQVPVHPNQYQVPVQAYHPNQPPPPAYHPPPQHPNQYHNQAPPQQYQPNQQAYHQNVHPNQVPQQGYNQNPPYHADAPPNQNNQQYNQNSQQQQQQYPHSQNNQQQQHQPNQNSQQQQHQPNQNSQQQQYQPNQNSQQQHQPNQNSQQQQYQPNQNNVQPQYQNNPPQYQQNNQQQHNSNNPNQQQQYQNNNQQQKQNNQPAYHSNQAVQQPNVQPPASKH